MQHIDALSQLCELLSVSTEDSISMLPVETLAPTLVSSLAPQSALPGKSTSLHTQTCMFPQVDMLNKDHSPDIMLLAARALTFMADAMPSSCHAIVRHGAVQAFCGRLLVIEYIDLAEQCLQVSCQQQQQCP